MEWDWIQVAALAVNMIKVGLDIHNRWKSAKNEKSLTSKERGKRTEREDSNRVTKQQ